MLDCDWMTSTGTGASWNLTIQPCAPGWQDYYTETLASLEMILDTNPGCIHLLYSGGLDSEYVARLLHSQAVHWQPVILNLHNSQGQSYNSHDTAYAYRTCAELGVVPQTFDLDFDWFVSSGTINRIAESIECCLPSVLAPMYVAETLGVYTIQGNGEPHLIRHNNRWWLEESQAVHSVLRFYHDRGLPGCPFFLGYRAQQFASFLTDPVTVDLGHDRIPGKQGSHSSKHFVYTRGTEMKLEGYDWVSQSRIKFTGYENIWGDSGSQIQDHANIRKFQKYRQQWQAQRLYDYTDLVELFEGQKTWAEVRVKNELY